MSDDDRRRAERVKVNLAARYRPADDHSTPLRNGTIDNISRGGLLLIGGETFSHGTRLHITFDDKDGASHEIVCDVVRSQAMGGFGVAFIHVGDATLEYVRGVLGVT
jgi:c-di-GMP-binding flagellar brake protein YcgR